jgi:general nucleoside transport system permease protein
MPLRIEPREHPSAAMAWLSPLVAVAMTGGVMLVIFAGAGLNPLNALWLFMFASVSDLYGVGELLIKAAPLVMIAIGLSVGFRAGVWNIGAEGQLVLGVIFGGWLALTYGPGGGAWVLPAMIATGALGGVLWAAIPALLRTRFNANEILTSLMLNYIALLWLSYLVYGPWRDPAGFNFPQSAPLAEAARYWSIIDDTRAHAGVLLALAAVVAGWLLLSRSFTGFQLTITGLSRGAARYAGFRVNRAVWIGMLCGGLAAGVAGVGEIAGPLGQIFPTASPGYGYAAIIVAFLGRLHPIGILLAGLLMSLLYLGGDVAQMSLRLPSSITGLLQGTLLFFLLASDVLITHRIRYARDGGSTTPQPVTERA